MMSWSYQSSNPCTVLVKEKSDSHHVDCSPSIQSSSSTNRPNQDTSVNDHQQDSVVSSSLGNIIGGKAKKRVKRQVLDVVVDGDGHEEEVEIVEKRILVNISIGMDNGLGTSHQEVYKLQVAVPLKNEAKNHKDFYTYQIHENENYDEEEIYEHVADDEENTTENVFTNTTSSSNQETTTFDLFSASSSSSFPTDCCEGLHGKFYKCKRLMETTKAS